MKYCSIHGDEFYDLSINEEGFGYSNTPGGEIWLLLKPTTIRYSDVIVTKNGGAGYIIWTRKLNKQVIIRKRENFQIFIASSFCVIFFFCLNNLSIWRAKM